MGSAQSTPTATGYTRGARAEDKISSDNGEVQLHALALFDAPFTSSDDPATPLLAEVRKIGMYADMITTRFAAIAAVLAGMSDPRRSAGDVLYLMVFSLFEPFDPWKGELLRRQWSEIAQLHKKTLWRSRKVAAINAAKIKGFVEDFIPYLQSDEDLDEKKVEISAYLEVNKKRNNEEQQLHDEFQVIGEKLEIFKAELQEASLSDASGRVMELERGIEPKLREAISDTASLSRIWGMIRTDLIQLNMKLEDAANTAGGQYLFPRRLASIKKCYQCLHCALYEYAAALDIEKAAARAGCRYTL